MSATSTAPDGTPAHRSGGDRSAPLHVNSVGIVSPSRKAALVTWMVCGAADVVCPRVDRELDEEQAPRTKTPTTTAYPTRRSTAPSVLSPESAPRRVRGPAILSRQ